MIVVSFLPAGRRLPVPRGDAAARRVRGGVCAGELGRATGGEVAERSCSTSADNCPISRRSPACASAQSSRSVRMQSTSAANDCLACSFQSPCASRTLIEIELTRGSRRQRPAGWTRRAAGGAGHGRVADAQHQRIEVHVIADGFRHCVHRSSLRMRRARHHAATPTSSSNRPITAFESKNSAASARAACWCRRGSRWIASTPADGFLDRAKRDQAFADGVGAAEAGVLHERGLSRGEIPHGPIAEPAAVGGDVDALRRRAFGVRAQDVVVERLRIGHDADRVDDPPPVTAKQVQVACVGWMNVEGDLELGRRPLRQVDELPELVDLQPERRRTVLNGTVRPAPTRDRREPPGPRRGSHPRRR